MTNAQLAVLWRVPERCVPDLLRLAAMLSGGTRV